VQCFYDAGEMLMIQKDECICCSLCVSECPVEAIFDEEELSTEQHVFLTRAQSFFGGKTPAELQALHVSP
jgi:ferredoxin